MVDIKQLLATLATHRPVFHSEADFQHSLAWQIQKLSPSADIRLELPFRSQVGVIHLDVWVWSPEQVLAIELKYKTRGLSVQVGSEPFSLADQSAQDLGRYDFLKDVQRLEHITASQTNATGYAILLTNDSAYWAGSGRDTTAYAAFRLEQGRTIQGELKWGAGASEGTKRGREASISLRGKYVPRWVDYSRPSIAGYGTFRYVVLEVR